METILRSKEMAEIIFLPVRHHSPACAWHVKKMIEARSPSLILIEGPCNADALIPAMTDEETHAPFAVYYSYRDRTGRLSEKKGHYRCYYPFLDYSPELAAMREGRRRGIETAFIDLPYGDILAATQEGKGLLQEREKPNYNDDYLLSRSSYLQRLSQKAGLRSFDEFWEKYFEVNGIRENSETWFSHLYEYCTLARADTPEEELIQEGCLAREAFMASQIVQRAKAGKTIPDGESGAGQGGIFVITGGFHTPALQALVIEGKKKEAARTRIPSDDQEVYLMPYSMEAADALNGYASGMPYPGFYQKIWQGLGGNGAPYHDAVLDFIVSTGKAARKKGEMLSTFDDICAMQMAEGLAALRRKPEPGAYELKDAVLSAFIKGECNLATDRPLRILQEQMRGRGMGKLGSSAAVPPIVLDFEEQCRLLGISFRTTLEREVTLSLFSSQKHRRMSMFFHRTLFLNASFARRVKGPNLQGKRDRNLIREIWKYKWSAQVSAALIDVSVYGAAIEEACVTLVRQRLARERDAREGALLLTQVFEMGLESQMTPVYDRVYEILQADTDFASLSGALEYFMDMQRLQRLYLTSLRLDRLTQICCRKLITLLPSMTRIKEEESTLCMNTCKLLYQMTRREWASLQDSYFEALFSMLRDRELHPGLDGCIHGILYGCGKKDVTDVEKVCRGYLMGTYEQLIKTVGFFRGLFFTARDLVFIGSQFIDMLDSFLRSVSSETFMELLPELRLAFGYFTPGEIDKIAAAAARLHGKSGTSLLAGEEVLPGWYDYGRALDGLVTAQMEGCRDD